ncbi:MAG: sialidase family protein [Acidimicrobiales bacterium]
MVLSGLALVAQACGSGDQLPVAAAPDVLVTDDTTVTRTHEAPYLLVDGDDPDTVYLSESELQSGDCRFYVSTNRGQTWAAEGSTVDSPVETEKDPGAPPAPELANHSNCSLGTAGAQNIRTELDQAPDGTIYYTFHANDPNPEGSRSILLGRSNDGGRSWETTVVDAGDEPGDQIEVNFQAHTAIDPKNPQLIYTMWRRSYEARGDAERPPSRPYMAVSKDGGKTFGEPFEMLDLNPGFDGPRPVVVDGRLFAFYRQSAPPSSAGPAQDTKLFVATSTDQGQSWAEPSLIASAPDASEPVPLYDRDRKMFDVVFHDNRNGDLDVFYTSSKDGAKWTAPKRLNDDKPENDVGQYYPQISQSPDGRLDVAWYDYRNDPGPPPVPEEAGDPLTLSDNLGTLQSVYYSSSKDGGTTWTPNLKVTDVPIDRSIGTWNAQFFVVVPLSIASWDDRALVTWSDTRNGTSATGSQDIFTGAVAPVGDEKDSTAVQAVAVVGAVLLGAGLALLAAVGFLRRSRKGSETA